MGFGGSKAAHDTLLNANSGEVYEVTTVKNDRGYIDWTAAVKGGAATPAATYAPNSPKPASSVTTTAAPKSNYETPEERAKKQVYIVRQSSISSAIDLLSVGSKSAPDVDKVLETASRFEAFVFGDSQVSKEDVAGSFFPDTPKADFTDTGDDIPF